MMKKISVGIIEDNHSLRKRLSEHFTFEQDIILELQTYSGEELLKYAEKNPPIDVLLMDIELPGISGIEATAKIKVIWPATDIIMFTVYEDDERVFDSIVAGASGYLLKETEFERIVESIHELFDGGSPISTSIARKVLRLVKQAPQVQKELQKQEEFDLTEREREILKWVTEGMSNKEIADKLFVSPLTIKTHIKNVYAKLHVHSRAGAANVAIKNRLI
jgi:DNA-binding NarL/FixJ family response regulator